MGSVLSVALPIVGSFFGPVGTLVGAVAGSLLSDSGDDGGGGGGATSGIGSPTAPGASTMPQPGTLLTQPAGSPGDIGAGLEETNAAEAKKVSQAAQSRRRGRRATILTGGESGEEAEFLGGV